MYPLQPKTIYAHLHAYIAMIGKLCHHYHEEYLRKIITVQGYD